MNEIEQYGKQELAWNGQRVKATDEEISRILGPMFVMFSQVKVTNEMIAVYVMMLRDVEKNRLADAVLKAMNTCKFLPTVADIREQLEARIPGPSNDADPRKLRPVPTKMFRLDDDEDKRQRMAQLRRTDKWSKYYA